MARGYDSHIGRLLEWNAELKVSKISHIKAVRASKRRSQLDTSSTHVYKI